MSTYQIQLYGISPQRLPDISESWIWFSFVVQFLYWSIYLLYFSDFISSVFI